MISYRGQVAIALVARLLHSDRPSGHRYSCAASRRSRNSSVSLSRAVKMGCCTLPGLSGAYGQLALKRIEPPRQPTGDPQEREDASGDKRRNVEQRELVAVAVQQVGRVE